MFTYFVLAKSQYPTKPTLIFHKIVFEYNWYLYYLCFANFTYWLSGNVSLVDHLSP